MIEEVLEKEYREYMGQIVGQELSKQAAWSEVLLTNPIESVSQINKHFYYSMVVKEKCKL